VAKVGTSKVGSTVSQLGCGTYVACHGSPLKKKEKKKNMSPFVRQFAATGCGFLTILQKV
jgi:hypothetical protein